MLRKFSDFRKSTLENEVILMPSNFLKNLISKKGLKKNFGIIKKVNPEIGQAKKSISLRFQTLCACRVHPTALELK